MEKNKLNMIPAGKKEEEGRENSVESVFETRKNIINALKANLESNPKVIAAFLAGSDADGVLDEYSDIDFDMVVEPDSIDEVEKQVKEILEKFSPIKNELRVVTGKGMTIIHQFENISKFLHVDVLFVTDADKIDKSEVKVLFDKKDVIRAKEHSEAEMVEKIKDRIEKIEKNRELRGTYVEKSINRGDYLEAEDRYRDLILKKLVEVLRLLHCPEKSHYHVKHIYKDLPEEIVKEIEDLLRVSSVEEIKEKQKKANELMNQTLEKIKQKHHF